MIKKTSFGLILVILFFLFPQPISFAKDPQSVRAASISLATLENINGKVYVKKGGGIKELRGINGMDIAQGDSVRTDIEGSANLVFHTGSKMTAGPNTSFTIDKLKETRSTRGKISIRLISGTLWNSVKSLINAEDEYEIVTTGVTTQVRGTQLLVSVDPRAGQSTMSVLEGSVVANYPSSPGNRFVASQQIINMGQGVSHILPPIFGYFSENTSGIYPLQLPPTPPPPPPPAPLNMLSFIQDQDPFILANMAMDMLDRMQELQGRSEDLLSSYQNMSAPTYLQSVLHQSQANSCFASLNQQYMDAVQGSGQEQYMNQFLQQQNRDMDSLRQQAQHLQEQAEQTRNNATNTAQQAGLTPEQIERILRNAVVLTAGAGAAAYQSPIITPPPPSGSGVGSGPINVPGLDDNDSGPVVPVVPVVPEVPIRDLRSTSVSGTSLTLEWSIAQNLNNVKLQTSYDGQNWTNFIGNYTIDSTAITVYDLNPNTLYYFRLMIAVGINRGASNMISITTDKTQLIRISDITGIVRVGEALSVGMVTPDNATTTYQWQIAASVDGSYEDIRGANDNQYIIAANDVNKYIRVVAIGTGDYAGTVISNPTEAVTEPIPISWMLPLPTVSFYTEGDTPQIVVEYIANQRGAVYYIVTGEYFVIEDDQELIDFMTFRWVENGHIILSGSEEFSSEVLEKLVIPYSKGIYSDKTYNLYMVLEGVYNTYSEVERITFSTPKDAKPPALTASVIFNEATSELNINHFVKDYDEFYDLFVWAVPRDASHNLEASAPNVKEMGRALQSEYLSQTSGINNVARAMIPNYQPATEYIIYLVAQDHSHVGQNEEGFYSEVIEVSVTTPIPITE